MRNTQNKNHRVVRKVLKSVSLPKQCLTDKKKINVKKKPIHKFVKPIIDLSKFENVKLFNCYENDKHKFIEVDLSNNHTILKDDRKFCQLVSTLKELYLRVDKKYAIIYIYDLNNYSLYDIIKFYNNKKVNGIKFLNSNHNTETCIEFTSKNTEINAKITYYESKSVNFLRLNSYDDIINISTLLKKLNNRRQCLCNTDIVMDNLIKYTI